MRKKYTDVCLLIIGTCSLIYFIILLASMSFTSFLLIYPLFTCFVYAYALYELRTQKSILAHLHTGLRRTFIGGICVVLLLFIGVEVCLLTQAQQHHAKKSDYIVVLGAQINGNRISESLMHRLDAALILHAKHPTTPIVVSGGKGPGENNSEAHYMKQYLIQKGVDEALIIKEDKSRDTAENIAFTKAILDTKKKTYTTTIITNGFHTFRAQFIAQQQGLYVQTYAAKSHKISTPHFYIREFFAFCKDWFSYL